MSKWAVKGKESNINLYCDMIKQLVPIGVIDTLTFDPDFREYNQIKSNKLKIAEASSVIVEYSKKTYNKMIEENSKKHKKLKHHFVHDNIVHYLEHLINKYFHYIHIDLMAPLTFNYKTAIYGALDHSATGLVMLTLARTYVEGDKKNYAIARKSKTYALYYVMNSVQTLATYGVTILDYKEYLGINDLPMVSYYICYTKDAERLKTLLKLENPISSNKE